MNNQTITLEVPEFFLSQEELENLRKGAREAAIEDYFRELESLHRKEIASINWLEVFPEEAKKIIPVKIKELQNERKDLADRARLFQAQVKTIAEQENKDEFFVWFWAHEYVKYEFAVKIVEIDRQLSKLRMQVIALKPPAHDQRSLNRQRAFEAREDQKRKARDFSLETLAAPNLHKARRFGNQIKALCPFHQEKTPSFVIYVNDNHFHCYGCGKHGDSIAFLMEKEKIDFKEAVRRLAA